MKSNEIDETPVKVDFQAQPCIHKYKMVQQILRCALRLTWCAVVRGSSLGNLLELFSAQKYSRPTKIIIVCMNDVVSCGVKLSLAPVVFLPVYEFLLRYFQTFGVIDFVI